MRKLINVLVVVLFVSNFVLLYLGTVWEKYYYGNTLIPFYVSLGLFTIFFLIFIARKKNVELFFKNYLKILIVWVALGITITGLFYVFPPQKAETEVRMGYPPHMRDEIVTRLIDIESYYKVSVLITIVGALLIGGLGATAKKN
jgi:hypothetical protein